MPWHVQDQTRIQFLSKKGEQAVGGPSRGRAREGSNSKQEVELVVEAGAVGEDRLPGLNLRLAVTLTDMVHVLTMLANMVRLIKTAKNSIPSFAAKHL